MEATKMKVLWMISERNDKSYWTRVGAGFVNRDGSITLALDAVPVGTSKLQVRDYTPRDAESEAPDTAPQPAASRWGARPRQSDPLGLEP